MRSSRAPALGREAQELRAQVVPGPDGAELARVGHPIRRLQQGEGDGPARRFEIVGHAALDPLDIDARMAGQHGLDDDVEGRAHHLPADIDLARGIEGEPAIAGPRGGSEHRGREAEEPLVPEDRSRRAPLPAPVGSIRRQDRVAESRPERPAHGFGLHEGVRLLDEHLPDEIRIHHEHGVAVHEPGPEDILLEDRLRPDLDRVADHGPDQLQRGELSARRIDTGRVRSRGLGQGSACSRVGRWPDSRNGVRRSDPSRAGPAALHPRPSPVGVGIGLLGGEPREVPGHPGDHLVAGAQAGGHRDEPAGQGVARHGCPVGRRRAGPSPTAPPHRSPRGAQGHGRDGAREADQRHSEGQVPVHAPILSNESHYRAGSAKSTAFLRRPTAIGVSAGHRPTRPPSSDHRLRPARAARRPTPQAPRGRR